MHEFVKICIHQSYKYDKSKILKQNIYQTSWSGPTWKHISLHMIEHNIDDDDIIKFKHRPNMDTCRLKY